jgi:Transposase, Mutator family
MAPVVGWGGSVIRAWNSDLQVTGCVPPVKRRGASPWNPRSTNRRTRPLDQGPYAFLAADALVLKVRDGGRVVNVHALLATGVNGDGHREILGLQVTSADDGAGWLGFFRDLTTPRRRWAAR